MEAWPDSTSVSTLVGRLFIDRPTDKVQRWIQALVREELVTVADLKTLNLLDDASWARINLPVGVEAEIRWAISPPAFIKDAGQNPQSFSSAPVSLPAGWREQRASTGRVYYVSPTGISQWHPPVMVVLHQSPPQQAVRSSSQALDPQQPQQKSQKPDKIEQIGKAVEVTGKTLDVVGQLVNLIGGGQGANQ